MRTGSKQHASTVTTFPHPSPHSPPPFPSCLAGVDGSEAKACKSGVQYLERHICSGRYLKDRLLNASWLFFVGTGRTVCLKKLAAHRTQSIWRRL